jgi:hypothetical protein
MKLLKTFLVTFVLALGACGDDETDRGNLGVGDTCTENADCASQYCSVDKVCVTPPPPDVIDGGDDGTGGTPDAGMTGGTADGGTDTTDGGTAGGG